MLRGFIQAYTGPMKWCYICLVANPNIILQNHSRAWNIMESVVLCFSRNLDPQTFGFSTKISTDILLKLRALFLGASFSTYFKITIHVYPGLFLWQPPTLKCPGRHCQDTPGLSTKTGRRVKFLALDPPGPGWKGGIMATVMGYHRMSTRYANTEEMVPDAPRSFLTKNHQLYSATLMSQGFCWHTPMLAFNLCFKYDPYAIICPCYKIWLTSSNWHPNLPWSSGDIFLSPELIEHPLSPWKWS